MSYKKTKEFEKICEDILNNNEFLKLDTEMHHGITRFDHSVRVAKMTYNICKSFKMKKCEETTRAALLHDFYLNDDCEGSSAKKLVNHPNVAVKNAEKYYTMSELQENIIASHMYPICKTLPKYKESLVVSIADKMVASYEMYRYKMSMQMGTFVLFIANVLMLNK